MDIFDVISLLGGLAMFLYGMRLMGDSLKENSSGALKRAMEKVTNNPFKAFLLGIFVTALIQSSTAMIVITAGLVGAGILTLRQSLGIIVGANVGTTVTGQIIRLLDIDASGTAWLRFFQPSTLAPVALIIGMLLIMGHFVKNAKSVGSIAIGFGILFSGLLDMTGSVAKITQSGAIEHIFSGLGENPFLGYLTGAGVAFMLQSSSVTVGILQAFSASGMLAFKAIYSVIVGIYLGDCVTTAIVCSIGANAEARRVWNRTVNSGIIANTNTIFNLSCSICLFPMLGIYEKLSRRIVKDEPETVKDEKYRDELEALNPSFVDTPALALRSCYQVLLTMLRASRTNIEKAFRLLEEYDGAVRQEILSEEENIDHLTDCCSRYTVQLLPHLQLEQHVAILSQYYKVTAEFERLGDHAVGIAEIAVNMVLNGTSFSQAAVEELHVVESALTEIMDLAENAFKNCDEESARKIEPLVQIVNELSTVLRRNHLRRLSLGQCNMYADSSYSNLGVEFRRIAAVCSNVGVATVVRLHPELADHEHLYFESLHNGNDAAFNAAYEDAHARYFRQLEESKKSVLLDELSSALAQE